MLLSFRGRPAEDDAIKQLRLACEAGAGVIDSAEAYCLTAEECGHNERLIAKAIAPLSAGDRPLIVTKGGQFRAADGTFTLCGKAAYLREACERSLRNLALEAIDLYFLHWPDPQTPLEESLMTLADLRQQGKVRFIGVSNVSEEQLRAGSAVTELHAVQSPLSPDRLGGNLQLARMAEALGVGYLAYWPLGGRHGAGSVADRHPVFAEVGRRHGVSPQRCVLAWLLTLSRAVIPIPGSRRPQTLLDSLAAASLALIAADLEEIDASMGDTAPDETGGAGP